MLNLHLSIEASSIFYNLLMIISGLPRVKTARNVRGYHPMVQSVATTGQTTWQKDSSIGRRRSTASASEEV
jgi:hypothetical protein